MAMTEAAISITAAICTRGRPDQLRRAISSLQAQSLALNEILVVDNAPRDDATRQAVAGFEGVRYVLEPIPGLDFARNRALREARGDVVAFLDDDAVADVSWAQAIAGAFAERPLLAACTGRVEALSTDAPGQALFEANGGFSRGHERVVLPRDASRRLHNRSAPLIAWAVSIGAGCSLAVMRETALSIGGFDEALDLGPAMPGGGDHDMLWRLLQHGRETIYEPAALAWHDHRKDAAAAEDQIIGHQRALMTLLVKCAVNAQGRVRLSVLAFLVWRLVKPLVRLGRRLQGRDPLSIRVLLRMTGSCWSGLWGYAYAQREAQRRSNQFNSAPQAPIKTLSAMIAGALSGHR